MRTTNTNTKYFVTIKIVLTIPRNPFAGKPSWTVIFKDYGLTKYEEGGDWPALSLLILFSKLEIIPAEAMFFFKCCNSIFSELIGRGVDSNDC